jgi:type I restriction enzyme R subunit
MNLANQSIGQKESATQERIVRLFTDGLGYGYLGNWEYRLNNSNIEEPEVRKYLLSRGYNTTLIGRALDKLRTTATNYNESLYTNNQSVYKLLRGGIGVVEHAGEPTQQVHLIDWTNPESNNFAIAEEVSIQGNHDKRPDIVIYVNGIALGIIELKRSTVSIGEGIRQSIVNKKSLYNPFFQQYNLSLLVMTLKGLNTEPSRPKKSII